MATSASFLIQAFWQKNCNCITSRTKLATVNLPIDVGKHLCTITLQQPTNLFY